MLRRALDNASSAQILCADGGALHARRQDLLPQTIIGDLDSLSPEQVQDFAATGAEILRFPAEKDETDLELALYWCVEQGAQEIIVLGALGGRFDQTLANLYLLALPALRQIRIELVDGEQSVRLLRPGSHIINGHAGDTVSLIPLVSAVEGISTSNLKYPLRDETLQFGPARGISNVMLSENANVEFSRGLLVLVHTLGRA